MVIRCSSYRLFCFIYFAYFCCSGCLGPALPPACEGSALCWFRGGFDLKPPALSSSSHPPDKPHFCLFFPPLLSTSPPVSALSPTSLHFSLSWRSPGNYIQTAHKGMEQRSGHTNEGLYIFRQPESYNPSSTTPSLSTTAAGCPSINRSLLPSLFSFTTLVTT